MKGILPVLVTLAIAAPAISHAQECGKLQLVNSVQMTRDDSGVDFVPVSINGVQKNFLFDTGGAWTSVSKPSQPNCTCRRNRAIFRCMT